MQYDQLPCDWETKGVGVFDLSDLTWGSVYNAHAGNYTVPSRVSAKIGGTTNGGATMLQPSPGFDQEGLSTLFNVPWKSNTTNTAPTPPAAGSRTSTSVGIIGGIIGRVALIALLTTLSFVYRRRLHKWVTGEEYGFAEMGDTQKVNGELMARSVCAEMPAVPEPVEIWSPEKAVEMRSPYEGGDEKSEKGKDLWGRGWVDVASVSSPLPEIRPPPITKDGIPF